MKSLNTQRQHMFLSKVEIIYLVYRIPTQIHLRVFTCIACLRPYFIQDCIISPAHMPWQRLS